MRRVRRMSALVFAVMLLMSSIIVFPASAIGKDDFYFFPLVTKSMGGGYMSAAVAIQKFLLLYSPITYNYVNTNGGTDGFFGSGSANATVYFQNSEGLDPDGKVGSLTWMKIGELLKDEDGWDSDAPHYWYPNDIGVDISNTRVIIYVGGYRSVTRSGTAKEVFYR